MKEIQFVFSLYNDGTEHYDYAQSFEQALTICEIIYNVKGEEWELVKESNDLFQIEMYMHERGYEAEVINQY